MKNELYESELKRHLGPVKAPDNLWDRVHVARAVKPRPDRGISWQWATIAVATVAVIAGFTVWLNRDLTGEELAVRGLSHTAAQLDFRSDNLTEVRAWVKSGTGLDVPLPVRTAPSVRMIGARINRGQVAAAEISYRVGDSNATLVVSRIPANGDGRHAFVKSGSYHGTNFQSWTMRGQMYTLASADARVGCILCHSTGAPRTTEN